MKENLLKLKRAIDRKYFASINGDETTPENLIKIVSEIDTDGYVRFILDMMDKSKEYLESNDINYDEIILNLQFSPFFNERYYDRLDYIKCKKINPVDDLLMVNINSCGYMINNKRENFEPFNIDNEPFKTFIISFRDFKNILSYLDIELQSFTSFDDIKNKFWKDNITTDEVVRGKRLELVKKK